MRTASAVLSVAIFAVSGSAYAQELPGVGPNPKLPEPQTNLLPTVNIAPAKSWPEGGKPTAASGLNVTAFAAGLDHPRWLYTLPNGDVLVAETNAPPKLAQTGIKAWFMKLVMRRATGPAPSANRIRLLRDADGDGVAEVNKVFLKDLYSPFGMALVGDNFYVANADAVHALSLQGRRDHRRRSQGCRSAGRPAQSPLDEEHPRQQGRQAALRDGRLQQQRRRERARQGDRSRRDPRDRSRNGQVARVRVRPAQSQRPCVGADDGRAVDRRQRARRTRQRPRAGLSNEREGRRILRLAVQLLGPACRYPRERRRSPISSPRRSRPTMASARTSPHWAWRSTTARCCPSSIAAAPSSACTARGTASRAAATR